MALTPEHIQNTARPVIHTENGYTLAVIDAENYRNLSPEERNAYRTEMGKHPFVRGQPGLVFKVLGALDNIEFGHVELTAVENGQMLVMDTRSKHNFYGVDTDADIYHFTFEHEMAHGFYKLKEAGADYFAGVETLLKNPDSRADLVYISQERLYLAFRDNEKDGDFGRYRHGIETVTALKAALRLSPEELQRLAALPEDERRRQVAAEAKTYDDLSDMHDSMPRHQVPFENVRKYFIEAAGDDLFRGQFIVSQVKAVAAKVLGNAPFEAGTEEHAIVEDAKIAMPAVLDNVTRLREWVKKLEEENPPPGTTPANPASSEPAAPPAPPASMPRA